MRDHNQDSDAAQSGRPGKGEPNDKLEPTRDDAVPEYIATGATPSEGITEAETGQDVHPDGGDRSRRDTDRDELRDAETAELCARSRVPASLTFTLRAISSRQAKCFFCKEEGCDLVFMARSRIRDKTKAYAAHSQCVFDHDELQALGSGGV